MNLVKNRIHLLNETSFLTFSFMDRSIYTIIYLRLLGESSSKGKFRRNVRLQLYNKSVYRFTDCHAMTMAVYWDDKRNSNQPTSVAPQSGATRGLVALGSVLFYSSPIFKYE